MASKHTNRAVKEVTGCSTLEDLLDALMTLKQDYFLDAQYQNSKGEIQDIPIVEQIKERLDILNKYEETGEWD